MRFISRTPSAALAPFVDRIWYCESTFAHRLDRILPDGKLQLLVNLEEDQLRWSPGPDGGEVRRLRGAGLCGVYDGPFTIDTAEQRAIVGVNFKPGGAAPFFALPIDEVRDDHVELTDVWGRDGGVLREHLLEATTPEATLRTLEAALLARVVGPLVPDPVVGFAITALAAGATVGAVTDHVGLTPRSFIRRFAGAVGLTPKRFARIQRFRRVIDAVPLAGPIDWAGLAARSGYFDQAHLIHDFRAFAGLVPSAYRPRADDDRSHIPLA